MWALYSYNRFRREVISSTGISFSDFADFGAYYQGIFLGQLSLVLLLEVECAAVVLSITMLAAEHELTFTRESKKTNFLLASPAGVLVCLHDLHFSWSLILILLCGLASVCGIGHHHIHLFLFLYCWWILLRLRLTGNKLLASRLYYWLADALGNWLILYLLQLLGSLCLLGLFEALGAEEVGVVSAEELVAVVAEHWCWVILWFHVTRKFVNWKV